MNKFKSANTMGRKYIVLALILISVNAKAESRSSQCEQIVHNVQDYECTEFGPHCDIELQQEITQAKAEMTILHCTAEQFLEVEGD